MLLVSYSIDQKHETEDETAFLDLRPKVHVTRPFNHKMLDIISSPIGHINN